MLYTTIFVSIFVVGWLICAFVPWLVLSIATRGNAGLRMLPLCFFAGVVGALAVPVFGLTDGTGLWLSFLVAAAAPAILLGLRRFSLRPVATHSTPDRPATVHTPEGPRTK